MGLLHGSFIVLLCIQWVELYKIMIVSADGGSHVLVHGKMAKDLAKRGHNVTFVTSSTKKLPASLRSHDGITIDTFHNPHQSENQFKEYSEKIIKSAISGSIIDRFISYFNTLHGDTKQGLIMWNDTEFLTRMEKAGFDFAICDLVVFPSMVLPYKLGIPYALLGLDCHPFKRRLLYAPSHIPHYLTTFTDDITFWQRSLNLLAFVIDHVLSLSQPMDEFLRVTSKHLPGKPPVTKTDLIMGADLCITLRENLIDFIKPTMPDVVSMASLLPIPAKPLSDDLEKFMTEAPDGVILVSFGTWLDDFPDDILNKLLSAFSRISYKVLLKYRNEINMSIPCNVKVLPWVPQNDILGHQNIKLFITHCGFNSLIESTYHGVPMLSFPLGLDQLGNAAIAKSKHIAEIITVHDFTVVQLVALIDQMIGDQSYKKNVQRLSAAFKDLIKSGVANPSFWIEHVIKYGSSNLRSTEALNLAWYQYLMVDTMIVVLCVKILFVICLYKMCCRRWRKATNIKEKKE